MDHYCIRCVTYWCRIAVVVDVFGFMRWNHASFGRPGTGGRHYRNRRRVVVPRVVMAVVIVLLLLLMVVWLLVMVLMATVATATAGTVRQGLRRVSAHSARVLVLRSHPAARSHAIGGAIVL